MWIGYGQMPGRDQHPEAQDDALRAAGCADVVLDETSGERAARSWTRPTLCNAVTSRWR